MANPSFFIITKAKVPGIHRKYTFATFFYFLLGTSGLLLRKLIVLEWLCFKTLVSYFSTFSLAKVTMGQPDIQYIPRNNDCPSASKATMMNMDKYFMWIHYERLHNHNKAKHNKTVCIFIGIYCNHLPASCSVYMTSSFFGYILYTFRISPISNCTIASKNCEKTTYEFQPLNVFASAYIALFHKSYLMTSVRSQTNHSTVAMVLKPYVKWDISLSERGENLIPSMGLFQSVFILICILLYE